MKEIYVKWIFCVVLSRSVCISVCRSSSGLIYPQTISSDWFHRVDRPKLVWHSVETFDKNRFNQLGGKCFIGFIFSLVFVFAVSIIRWCLTSPHEQWSLILLLLCDAKAFQWAWIFILLLFIFLLIFIINFRYFFLAAVSVSKAYPIPQNAEGHRRREKFGRLFV